MRVSLVGFFAGLKVSLGSTLQTLFLGSGFRASGTLAERPADVFANLLEGVPHLRLAANQLPGFRVSGFRVYLNLPEPTF